MIEPEAADLITAPVPPAAADADKAGNKIWKLNGKLHRTDGPAIEYAYGRKAWCINGERHRADGPAIVNADGSKEWYINGIQYSYEDWKVMVDILTNFKKLGKLNINEDI